MALGSAGVLVSLLLSAPVMGYDVPVLPPAPYAGLPPHALESITESYTRLLKDGRELTQEVHNFHRQCDDIDATDRARIAACQQRSVNMTAIWDDYNKRHLQYTAAHAKLREKFPLPAYQLSGRGLVLGVTQVGGFNVPPGTAAANRARMREEAARQLDDAQARAGIEPFRRPYTEGYDFILGLARDPRKLFTNLPELSRGMNDSDQEGNYSRLSREVYASLKGRYFETLECHSNGAMVCLRALREGEVAAKSVRLLGPQLSQATLPDWEWLIEQGYVNRVKIFALSYDPVPLVTVAYSTIEQRQWVAALKLLRNAIFSHAPAVEYEMVDCPVGIESNLMACHAIPLYQQALVGAR
jgi:hypothetical protein